MDNQFPAAAFALDWENMTMTMDYTGALSYIHGLRRFGIQPGLERMEALLSRDGDPQREIKALHVAGTNGKGSTCAMLASVLREAGYRVGLFTSPYVVDFRERIQIDGTFIPEEEVARITAILCPIAEENAANGLGPTEFELITALAFHYFAEQHCDYVVLETGLGGRLDSTNVVENPLVSVITNIAMDHTDILGGTIREIAAEKCGIIKSGCPVVAAPQIHAEVPKLISDYAIELDCSFTLCDTEQIELISSDLMGSRFAFRGEEYALSLIGRHQICNAVTAIEALASSKIPLPEGALADGLYKATLPARLEVLSRTPLVLLDGAHNPDGIKALCRVLEPQAGAWTAIVGMMADKNYNRAAELLGPLCKSITTVTVEGYDRSLPGEELAKVAGFHCVDVCAAGNYDEALKIAADKSAGGPVVICGSFYLAGGIRHRATEYFKNRSW
ncbi:MAG: bifunctional folylpolyglutamate synthase/dihydrofolate synthase [Candidatus Howiella sp.]